MATTTLRAAGMPAKEPPGRASRDARSGEAAPGLFTEPAAHPTEAPTRDPDDISRPPDPRDEVDPPAWREDFPIDIAKDEFVARREFAKFMVLTSGAFAVGHAWIAAQHLVRQRRPALPRVKIAAIGELTVGAAKSFAYPTEHDPCLLVRLGEQELVAFSQACTHLSCAVVPRVAEGVFVCPCHVGVFDIRTGNNISGPPPRPLPRIVLEIEGDAVYAVAVEERTVAR